VDALAFLDRSAKSKRQPVYVLSGDEDFLRRRVRDAIVALALGDADPSFAVSTYAGEKLDFSAVRNDLETLPFLAPVRVVVVEQADPFVTEHRPALEKYVAAPSKIGVLVLEVKSFPETTKLAKALPDAAKLVCKAPGEDRLPGWCAAWARDVHGKELTPDAAGYLIELVGPQLGLIDQELAKLAVAVGDRPRIEPEDVEAYVGRSREADVFKILDAVGDGQPARALKLLAYLLEEGDDPLAILGPLTFQLRKLAAVERGLARGLSAGQAMDAAGVPTWPKARAATERQLRHIGRRRLARIPGWLVELNLGLKGGNPLPARLQLERLLVRLARPRTAASG
jgi:DNA polymerase-3 subunit delta